MFFYRKGVKFTQKLQILQIKVCKIKKKSEMFSLPCRPVVDNLARFRLKVTVTLSNLT